MTKYCKCGHPKSHHKMLSGGVCGNGIGSFPPEPHWCLKCDNCFFYVPIICVCDLGRPEPHYTGKVLDQCGCIYGCVGFDRSDRGFGNCTPEKCACDQVPHNKKL